MLYQLDLHNEIMFVPDVMRQPLALIKIYRQVAAAVYVRVRLLI